MSLIFLAIIIITYIEKRQADVKHQPHVEIKSSTQLSSLTIYDLNEKYYAHIELCYLAYTQKNKNYPLFHISCQKSIPNSCTSEREFG